MAQSATTVIETDGVYTDVETLTGVTFAEGNTYTMQVQNTGYLKVLDAEFELRDEFLQIKYQSDYGTIQIKTGYLPCTLTILEHAAA